MIARIFLTRLRGDETAATTVEYAMILAFIVMVILSSVSAVADENTGIWALVAKRSGEAHAHAQP